MASEWWRCAATCDVHTSDSAIFLHPITKEQHYILYTGSLSNLMSVSDRFFFVPWAGRYLSDRYLQQVLILSVTMSLPDEDDAGDIEYQHGNRPSVSDEKSPSVHPLSRRSDFELTCFVCITITD